MFFALVAAEFQRQHQQGKCQGHDSDYYRKVNQHKLTVFTLPAPVLIVFPADAFEFLGAFQQAGAGDIAG